MRLCATIIITPVSQPGTELHQMHHRLLYNLDKFSVWLTLYWPSKTPTAEMSQVSNCYTVDVITGLDHYHLLV